MNVDTHLGLNYGSEILPVNGDTAAINIARYYLATELFPRYSPAKNISVGIYCLRSHGLDAGTIGNTHFITLNTSFSKIKIAEQFFINVNPQLSYLILDLQHRYYFTSSFTVQRKKIPL